MFSAARLSVLRTKRRSLRPLPPLRCSAHPNQTTRAASGRSASPPPLYPAAPAAKTAARAAPPPNTARATTSPYAGMPRCVCACSSLYAAIVYHLHLCVKHPVLSTYSDVSRSFCNSNNALLQKSY